MPEPIKIVFLARRRENLDPQEFERAWLGSHADLVREIDGVLSYQINLVRSRQGDRRVLDGVAQITYRDRAALQAVVDSPLAAEIAADEERLFDSTSIVRVIVSEHTIV